MYCILNMTAKHTICPNESYIFFITYIDLGYRQPRADLVTAAGLVTAGTLLDEYLEEWKVHWDLRFHSLEESGILLG